MIDYMRRKSIFVSFMNGRLRVKLQRPRYTHNEDTEVGLTVACHGGDPLGTSCVGLGNGTDFVGGARSLLEYLKIRILDP